MENDSVIAAAGNIPSLFSLNFTDKTNAPVSNTSPIKLANSQDENYALNRSHENFEEQERTNQTSSNFNNKATNQQRQFNDTQNHRRFAPYHTDSGNRSFQRNENRNKKNFRFNNQNNFNSKNNNNNNNDYLNNKPMINNIISEPNNTSDEFQQQNQQPAVTTTISLMSLMSADLKPTQTCLEHVIKNTSPSEIFQNEANQNDLENTSQKLDNRNSNHMRNNNNFMPQGNSRKNGNHFKNENNGDTYNDSHKNFGNNNNNNNNKNKRFNNNGNNNWNSNSNSNRFQKNSNQSKKSPRNHSVEVKKEIKPNSAAAAALAIANRSNNNSSNTSETQALPSASNIFPNYPKTAAASNPTLAVPPTPTQHPPNSANIQNQNTSFPPGVSNSNEFR